jgi:hypothetical protein
MSSRIKPPRKDLALLRKLKDPGFSPSALLEAGDAILERANKLKGFVSGQRNKLGTAAVKTDWTLVHRQLGEEQSALERELALALQQVVESYHQEMPELVPCVDELRTAGELCRAERGDLRGQVRGLAAAAASIRAYGGPAQCGQEAQELASEMRLTSEDLQKELDQLAGCVGCAHA